MQRILLTLLAIFGILTLLGSSASAQATRTWVSGVGDDVNPCSRTAPCKTFAGAISKTAAGGTINCIDPGGFGAVTIIKSMTIDCESQGGGILAASTNGIIVNGPGVVASVRNLAIEGVNTGLTGVRIINAAAVHLNNVSITQFKGTNGAGIRVETPSGVTTELTVNNSRISDNGVAPNVGGGIVIQPAASASVRFAVDNVAILNNINGLLTLGPATGSIRGSISNSVVAGNDNAGINSGSSGAQINVIVQDAMVVGNGFGIGTSGTSAFAVDNSTVTANTVGVGAVAPSKIQSYGTNDLFENTTNGTFTAPALAKN